VTDYETLELWDLGARLAGYPDHRTEMLAAVLRHFGLHREADSLRVGGRSET
jgi:hypothetical protein